MKISDLAPNQDKKTRRKKFPSVDLSMNIQFKKGFNESAKIAFYRDMSLSISAGADLASAIGYLIDKSASQKDKLISAVFDDLLSGKSLSEALRNTGEFSEFEIVSIDIGEETGNLIEVLNTLADSLERARDLKRQLISISSYPLLLLFMTSGILIFMLYFVVPTFEDLYSRFDSELPELTKSVLYLSTLVNKYSITAFFMGVSILSYIIASRKNTVLIRKSISNLIRFIPVVNTLYKESVLAQYFGYFSMMLKSGLPINTALGYLQALTYFYPLKEHTAIFQKEIESGNHLHDTMEQTGFFDSQTVSLVRIGEDSNSLEKVFENLSTQYRKKSEFSLKTFGAVIEPVMIVFIAGIVAVILLAMYLPIFNFSSAI